MMTSRAIETPVQGPVWYCARTKPKHEHIAAAGLYRQFGMEVFHPRLRIERATQRGVARVIEPLFPCYVFVRCTEHELNDVRYAAGISSLVRFGSRIAVVPDAVVEELMICFEAGEPMAVEDRLYEGAEVVLAQGPFLGARGIIVRVLLARRRVQILLDFLGRATLTEVDRHSVTVEDRTFADLMPSLAIVPGAAIAA
jgi:transcriptional antiterminator RfaH